MPRNVILNMPAERERVYFNPYSIQHRNEHDGISYYDVDQVSSCISCCKALLCVDQIFDNNYSTLRDFQKKNIKILVQVAEALKIPAWLVWYKADKDRNVLSVKVKQISPTFKPAWNELPTYLSWDQWVHYLEYKQQQHYPHCTNKPFFKYKIRRREFKRRQNYEKLFS
jgi:hypothetical protein